MDFDAQKKRINRKWNAVAIASGIGIGVLITSVILLRANTRNSENIDMMCRLLLGCAVLSVPAVVHIIRSGRAAEINNINNKTR